MLCEHIGLGGATLDAYLLERIPAVAATQARLCVVVLPGGGYGHLSFTSAGFRRSSTCFRMARTAAPSARPRPPWTSAASSFATRRAAT